MPDTAITKPDRVHHDRYRHPLQAPRIQHWDTRSFDKFLMSRANMPFKWGTHDCALFAADGIEAIIGIDIAQDLRGKYYDKSSAFLAIQDICGGANVEDAAAWCAAKFHLPEWPSPLQARRGDLVVFVDGIFLIAGLIHSSCRHIVAAGEEGLRRIEILTNGKPTALRAWHV